MRAIANLLRVVWFLIQHMEAMLLIVWVVLAGIWLFAGYLVAGCINSVLPPTRPYGGQAFRFAVFVIWPDERTVEAAPAAPAANSAGGRILWIVLGGWYMLILHVVTTIVLSLSVLGWWKVRQNYRLGCSVLDPLRTVIVHDEAGGSGAGGSGWTEPAPQPPDA